jgi:hypothetical protein
MRGHEVERSCALPEAKERGEAKCGLLSGWNRGVNPHEARAFGHRKWPEVHRADEIEDGGRCGDRKSDGDDCPSRKTYIAPKCRHTVSKVTQEIVEQAAALFIARRLRPLRPPAERYQGLSVRLIGRHPIPDVPFGRLIDVELHFLIESGIL